jgi:hypothetical protein
LRGENQRTSEGKFDFDSGDGGLKVIGNFDFNQLANICSKFDSEFGKVTGFGRIRHGGA